MQSLTIFSTESEKYGQLLKAVILKHVKINIVAVNEKDLHSEESLERDVDSFSVSLCLSAFRFLQDN